MHEQTAEGACECILGLLEHESIYNAQYATQLPAIELRLIKETAFKLSVTAHYVSKERGPFCCFATVAYIIQGDAIQAI